MRMPISQNERAHAPLVCKALPRQATDWPCRVESTRAKPTETSFELYEGPSGAWIVFGAARANHGGCTAASVATRRPRATSREPAVGAQVAALVSLVEAPANHRKGTTVAKEVMAIKYGNTTGHSIKSSSSRPSPTNTPSPFQRVPRRRRPRRQ